MCRNKHLILFCQKTRMLCEKLQHLMHIIVSMHIFFEVYTYYKNAQTCTSLTLFNNPRNNRSQEGTKCFAQEHNTRTAARTEPELLVDMSHITDYHTNQILQCDWLPEWAGWGYLAHSGQPVVPRKKMVFLYSISCIDQACSVKMSQY